MKQSGAPLPSRPVAAARLAAFNILSRVASTAAHSDDLLHAPAVGALSPEDRNLTTILVLGTLRWQIQLDTLLRPLLQRPEAELHPSALLALRLGLYQLLHLDRVPPHAAVHESVELTRANGAPHAAAMVNAILRRVLREKPAAALSTGRLAISRTHAEQAHPDWLLTRWRKRFGGAVARRIADYDQAEPPRHALFQADPLLPDIDDGSRLVAELAAVAHPAPRRILDCCAAPGGKTTVLAVRHPAADIVAADIHPKRLNVLRDRLDRNPLTARVRTVQADMTQPSTSELRAASFDLILCDVPCSGTGTLARNPEIRHRLRESDLPRMAGRQTAILSSALHMLAPGGRLVYSTCSLEAEENESVVAAACAAVSGVHTLSLASTTDRIEGLHTPALAGLTHESSLQTLPGTHPCDGFFASVLTR